MTLPRDAGEYSDGILASYFSSLPSNGGWKLPNQGGTVSLLAVDTPKSIDVGTVVTDGDHALRISDR